MSRVRPILFNGEMVRAILDGRKTVTRRIIKFPKNKYTDRFPNANKVALRDLKTEKACFSEEPFYSVQVKAPCQPGDILYVRETWFYEMYLHDKVPCEPDLPSGRYSHRYVYKADAPDYPVGIDVGATGWRPSIHMPKEAARIWLKVTDVRVERLQDITEEQAMAEGAIDNRGFINSPENEYQDIHSAREHFKKIWDSTIKKSDLDRYGWGANLWVWVIEFERCERPKGWPG